MEGDLASPWMLVSRPGPWRRTRPSAGRQGASTTTIGSTVNDAWGSDPGDGRHRGQTPFGFCKDGGLPPSTPPGRVMSRLPQSAGVERTENRARSSTRREGWAGFVPLRAEELGGIAIDEPEPPGEAGILGAGTQVDALRGVELVAMDECHPESGQRLATPAPRRPG